MATVNRHIDTTPPYNGLSPDVLNVPAQLVAFPKASASNAVYTTANHFTATNNTINVSIAAGTQVDVPRNVEAKFVPNTASASLYSAGTLLFTGGTCTGPPGARASPSPRCSLKSAVPYPPIIIVI